MSEGIRRQMFGGDGSLALCLSGGGFRALFFHLGVVKLLSDLKCLERVTYVFGVSGGSILAAHLGLNWSKYVSRSEDRFRSASNDLIRFASRDVRGRVLRRWALFQARASTLQSEYETLFDRKRLSELCPEVTINFLATSMTTGRLCAFNRDAFRVVHDDGTLVAFPAEAQPVAQAVAASSAFPPLFPPLRLDLRDLPRAQFPVPEYLTDGGVFDNLGISRLHILEPEAKPGVDRIMVSDASALFDHAPAQRFSLVLSRTSRTTDILMQRIASLENEIWTIQQDKSRLTVIGIGDVVPLIHIGRYGFRPQAPKVQRLLRSVRTDLDTFEVDLIRSLVMHGYEVAYEKALASAMDRPLDTYSRAPEKDTEYLRPWDPCPPGWPDAEAMREHAERTAKQESALGTLEALERVGKTLGVRTASKAEDIRDLLSSTARSETSKLEKLIYKASRRRLGLWNMRDWASWVLLAIGAVVAGAFGAWLRS